MNSRKALALSHTLKPLVTLNPAACGLIVVKLVAVGAQASPLPLEA